MSDMTNLLGTPNPEHLKILERMQTALLQQYEARLNAGVLSDTGMKDLAKFLRDAGWNLDPSKVSPTLRDKLTQNVDPSVLDDMDDDVIGQIGAA
jgi:hypothetical protein